MKKVLAAIMIFFSLFFFLMYVALLIGTFQVGDSAIPLNIIMFITLSIILLIPGGLLLFFAIKILRKKPKKLTSDPVRNISGQSIPSDSGVSFNPFDAKSVNDFVQEQLKQGEPSTVKISNGSITQTVVTSSSEIDNKEFNEAFNSFLGDQDSVIKEAAVSNDPVSLDCPGCGSKTTVYPNQSTNCEFCGTRVRYKE